MGSSPPITEPEYDAIVVGAGFNGCYTLHSLRAAGFKTVVLDDGTDLGGVWHWNCYPGARVDTRAPLYEYSNPRLWKDWTWKQHYPGVEEIRNYFTYVDKKWNLKKDVVFKTRVSSAEWDDDNSFWTVKSTDGTVRTARWFLLCTGFAAKPNVPMLKGLEKFKGLAVHTSKWPQEGVDYKGKRVAVVGNGSSGIQVIQEMAPDVAHMTVFQRSPTFGLPMGQKPFSEVHKDKSEYAALFELRKTTFGGIDFTFHPDPGAALSVEEKTKHFEKIWEDGGLSFWLATYLDVLRDPETNRLAYDFWRSKVLPRIKDPKTAELLAPKEPPYYFGTKRATLESRYYEIYSQDNVNLVSVKENPITEVAENGVYTQDGAFHELDILALATGFDSITGSILAIDIKGVGGQTLKSKWSEGVLTHLGMMSAGFPNLVFQYGPQAPTSFCNGPTCAELQGDWVLDTLVYMREHGKLRLDPAVASEQAWKTLIDTLGNATLLPFTESEYMGTNIPGKLKENLNWLGGFVAYSGAITQERESGYKGFVAT